jgi:16S rRNA (cytidine1402-2'-O)-methyltransferase
VVGIVSVQNLMSSMSLLAEQRRIERQEAGEGHAGLRCRPDGGPGRIGLAPGLYLVATPIGNLGDITLRALDVLKRVDRIACEDTRQTQKLLNHFQIETPTVSCHQHNERTRAAELIRRLKAGGRIALVSDAGMPGISDPGALAGARSHRRRRPVIPIPGANAASARWSPPACHRRVSLPRLPAGKAGARRTASKLAAEAG